MRESSLVESAAAAPSCTKAEKPCLPLSFAKEGDVLEVAKVKGRGELRHHLENLGFVEGAMVRVVSQHAGNMIVEVKGSQVALDKQAALRILAA